MNKLQWRLTLSYTLVTATAMLIAQILFIGMLVIYLWSIVETSIIPGIADAASARVESYLRAGASPADVAVQLNGVAEASAGLLSPDDPNFLLAVFDR